MKNAIYRAISELYPGYFALVMATGIVSIAAYLLGMPLIAWLLFRINVTAYIVLWLLTLARLFRYFPRLKADLITHTRGPGFFTMAVGTCVVGSQFVILASDTATATILWLLGLALWLVLMYTFFTSAIVGEAKPALDKGINGAWLISVVATESVSTLATLIASPVADWRETLLFVALGMFLLGCMLYVLIISLIFYRILFFRVLSDDMAPLYWVNMGATAITTLAGSRLMLSAPQWGFLQDILPFLKGFTLFFWIIGTWWIPLLLVLGVWRYVYKRFPLRYEPQYWSVVFPLGMYTVGTLQLASAVGLPLLEIIPRYSIYVALIAWLAAFAGLVHRLATSLALLARWQSRPASQELPK